MTKGEKGDIGLQGPKGDKGDQGVQGRDGRDGKGITSEQGKALEKLPTALRGVAGLPLGVQLAIPFVVITISAIVTVLIRAAGR